MICRSVHEGLYFAASNRCHYLFFLWISLQLLSSFPVLVAEVRVNALFKDSKLCKILEMVQDATARKSHEVEVALLAILNAVRIQKFNV